MSTIEKNISQFIKNQFPAIYREEGELFVEFVTQYYSWMEQSNNVLYHSRRLTEYKDIDNTVDDFVLKFKTKYLDGIQFDTAARTKNLVKNSLDLYRAKGTERAIDLFFRAVYGAPAEVYYPGDDIFRLSDGRWVKPTYLEVTGSDLNTQYVGKIIEGVNTKATAFVERYIRRKIKSKYIHLFYISAITGEFETGELVTLKGEVLKNIPTIIGSMSGLQVITGGSDFKVGDIVNLTSNNGLQGKARVANVSNLTGTVTYDLLDSGWGYTANAEVLISEKVLYLSNVQPGANTTDFSFDIFETVKQPMANLTLINGNTALNLVNNDLLFTYYANGTLAGKGRVLSYTNASANSTNGEVYVTELFNTLDSVIEPSANLAGTVLLTTADTPITGISVITAGSNTVDGVGTTYTTDLLVGQIVNFFAYNANNDFIGSEENIVSAIANNTRFSVTANAALTSSNVSVQSVGGKSVKGTGTSFNSNFVYGDRVAFFSNSTNYIIRQVNAVVNSTFMTLQTPVTFANSAAKYANVVSNNYVYTSANTKRANISLRTDKSTNANVMGVSTRNTLKLVNCSTSFANTDYLYQLNSSNVEIASSKILYVSVTGSNATVVTTNTVGVFTVNGTQPIRTRYANGEPSGKTANVVQLDLEIGVIDIGNTFTVVENNFIYGTNSFSNATVVRVSTGALANFSVSDTLSFPDSITIVTDPISKYVNIPLNSVSYGFPKLPSANVSTQYLDDILIEESYQIGGISSITGINPGKDYDYPPFVTIYEPVIAQYDRHDYDVEIGNVAGGLFVTGEIVYQDVGGQGIVKSANSTHLEIKRIEFNNSFDMSAAIKGRSSGASANLVSIAEISNILQIGLNAVVQSNVQTSTGSVSALEIYDSGFGYIQDETATFTSADGTRAGTAKVNLGKRGISEGFYANKNGQLSDGKKVFDGEYYQDFSYEIRSPIRVDKYSEMLKNILHVSGTKAFSATVLSEVANSSTNIISDITTTE